MGVWSWLAAPGVATAFAGLLYGFFRSAVNAHAAATASERRRADDLKAALDFAQERLADRDAQIAHILSAVKDITTPTAPRS